MNGMFIKVQVKKKTTAAADEKIRVKTVGKEKIATGKDEIVKIAAIMIRLGG